MAEIFDIMRFEYDTQDDQVMTDVYQDIAMATMVGAEEGVYEYGASIIYTFTSTNTSMFRELSIDGGVTWIEFIIEPSDSSDRVGSSYFFFKGAVSGNLEIRARARKENAVGILTIETVNVYIKRVK